MEKPEFSSATLSKLNSNDIEKVVKQACHKEDGRGRSSRKSMGIFKALVVKRLKVEQAGKSQIHHYAREITRY